MRALAALVLGVVLSAGCQLSPPGECAVTADCELGLTCQLGVCVGCSGDAACGSWQACSATRRCISRAGFCSAASECQAWQDCGADHTCANRPGECGTGADCGGWEQCTDHRCVALPGRCSGQADCAWYEGCRADHTCGRPGFDPAAVALWGTLDPAACGRRAVAPVDHADEARVGFDCATAGAPAMIGPDGDLYYSTGPAAQRGVARFEPDVPTFSGGWQLPAAPLANDAVVVAAGACAGAGVDHWLLQAGSGDVLWACPAAGGYEYRDAGGALRFSGARVLAWTAGGLRLTVDAAGFRVVDAGGTARDVVGLGPAAVVLGARTRGEAFWVVDGAGFGAPRRYLVDAAGIAAYEGAYAALPAGVALEASAEGAAAIDGAGRLLQRAGDGAAGVVVRRPLAPAAAEVAYREADAPAGANDLSAAAFRPWVLLRSGPLVTGP